MKKNKYCECKEIESNIETIVNTFICVECKEKIMTNRNETIIYCNKCAQKLMVCNKCSLQVNLFD